MACSTNISFHFCLIWQYQPLFAEGVKWPSFLHFPCENAQHTSHVPTGRLLRPCVRVAAHLYVMESKNHVWLFFYNLNVMTDFSALQKALVRWSPAKSHLAAWQRMSLICDFQFAVMSPLDAVLQQRCPYWHHCFFVFFKRSRTKVGNAVEQMIMFLVLLRSQTFIAGNVPRWK